MQVNALPQYDVTDNPTGCCPRFNPEGWDDQELHFKDKLFLKAQTRSLFHIPINMSTVFRRVMPLVEKANANNRQQAVVLSRDITPWATEHYFSIQSTLPDEEIVSDEEIVRLSGDYLTKVYEGPFKDARYWQKDMEKTIQSRGKTIDKTYFFYTTCPKCAKFYGKNYVVAVSQIH